MIEEKIERQLEEARASHKKKKKSDLLEALMDKERLLQAAMIEMEIADYEKVNWISLPFIPEDLGFKVHVKPLSAESPTLRVYYKDGVSIMKTTEGPWVISKGEDLKMKANFPSKFHAFQFLTMVGVKFKEDESTVPDTLNMPIKEFLKEKKENLDQKE